jgi:hypothetical protein
MEVLFEHEVEGARFNIARFDDYYMYLIYGKDDKLTNYRIVDQASYQGLMSNMFATVFPPKEDESDETVENKE